jgi:hypothetical protein
MSDLKASLKQSVVNRTAMVKKFGVVPLSILRISRGSLSRRIFEYQKERPLRHHDNESSRSKLKDLYEAGYAGLKTGKSSGDSVSQVKCGRGSGGISIMPAELVAFFAPQRRLLQFGRRLAVVPRSDQSSPGHHGPGYAQTRLPRRRLHRCCHHRRESRRDPHLARAALCLG